MEKVRHREIWLSPTGNDDTYGEQDTPCRTLARAMEILRDIKARNSCAICTVMLEEGTYGLDRPLSFDPEICSARAFRQNGHQPTVIFRAVPGAQPVISGGTEIHDWHLHDARRNIYKASVPGLRSRQFYVNGQRAVRARTKNAFGLLPSGFKPEAELPNEENPSHYVIRGGIAYRPSFMNARRWRDPGKWQHPEQVEAVLECMWKCFRVPVHKIQRASQNHPAFLEMKQPAWSNANMFFMKNGDVAQPGLNSFWQVTRFENAYEFLDTPGEWCLVEAEDMLYYIPRKGEDMAQAKAVLATDEVLVSAHGTRESPVCGLAFEGLRFCHATWMQPSGDEGYACDQGGFHLTGRHHRPNLIGHDPDVSRTPGNLRFSYAHHIAFKNCDFRHMGAVALDFDTGCQYTDVSDCRFDDISGAAIQLGGVAECNFIPTSEAERVIYTAIHHNEISCTSREYGDAPGICVGITQHTDIYRNTISHTGWAGIALGWGWGLRDPSGFPGVPGATYNMWQPKSSQIQNSFNTVHHNHISHYLETCWDGGAVYCCGAQGQNFEDALYIHDNVACHKRKRSAGNTFYTDGGSCYVRIAHNASFDNPAGKVWLGPPPGLFNPLPYDATPSKLNGIVNGGDAGGCRTYGLIRYTENYWRAGGMPLQEVLFNLFMSVRKRFSGKKAIGSSGINPRYLQGFFFDAEPFTHEGITYPTNLQSAGNHNIFFGKSGVPKSLLQNAGAMQPVTRAEKARSKNPLSSAGASFPPHNPGPSWNVPRVSMPELMALQPRYNEEWWYYVGVAHDENGKAFSLHLQIMRLGPASFSFGGGMLGIGWQQDADTDCYLYCEGGGLGATETGSFWKKLLPAAVKAAPVTDYQYDVKFRALGTASSMMRDLKLKNAAQWAFSYLPEESGSAPVGEVGACYDLMTMGDGLISYSNGAVSDNTKFSVRLRVKDFRGTVMEGVSGFVGPGAFRTLPGNAPALKQDLSLTSYECAQPLLRLEGCGQLMIGNKMHRLVNGWIWLDRQMVTTSATKSDAVVRSSGKLSASLRKLSEVSRQLYCGDWMALSLDDGHLLTLVAFWRQSNPQWLTGNAVGKPPLSGFGNLYFGLQTSDRQNPPGNGGVMLKPKLSETDVDWDYDVNILGYDETAPHWTSPDSGHVYASAWKITFSGRTQEHFRLPAEVYVRPLSRNCEILPTENTGGGFFEGAGYIFSDPECRYRIGNAFIEQMGFAEPGRERTAAE